MIVTRVASATAEFDLTKYWQGWRRGKESWDLAPALTRELSACFTAAVDEAVGQAGDRLDRLDTEFVTATWYGTSHVAEVMHEQLREGGPRWLSPEQFLYYSPHSVISAAALAVGLGGAGSTLLGPDAEYQALAHAIRRIRSGRAACVVVAGYEALTPFAAVARPDGPTLPDDGMSPTGQATALVLMADDERPAVPLPRGRNGTDAQGPAERHGPTVVEPGPGLLRKLAASRTSAFVLSDEQSGREGVLLS